MNYLPEMGWLIERPAPHGMTEWWNLGDTWTSDSAKAVRFARKQDAQAVMWWFGVVGAEVTEHMWCGPDKPYEYG